MSTAESSPIRSGQSNAWSASGWMVVAMWLATFALGYWGLGGYLGERVEGTDPSMIPIWPLLLLALTLLLALVGSVLWARRLGGTAPQSNAGSSAQPVYSGRRRFLAGTAAVTGGVVGTAAVTASKVAGWGTVTGPALALDGVKTDPAPRSRWQGARVQNYRRLGRTEARISDISFGATQFLRHPNPAGLLAAALDRGVNYVDTSPDYGSEKSERVIAEVIKDRSREQLFLATKFCTSAGHVRQGSSVQQYMSVIDDSLARLGTEYVDLVHIHACDSLARLLDPNVHEAFDRLKAAGKVRFMGVSTHTPNLEEVASAAIDSDRFDVMMLAYHHGAWPQQRAIIDRAHERDMGIIAMKTLKGAKHKGLAEFRDESDSFTQAAFKWVLDNPSVSGLVISFFENQHLDEYLYASGQSVSAADLAVLDKYDRLIAGTHCFQHCGDCLSSCPEALPINDILRHRMYFEDYGDQKQAMQLYARLERRADACIDCAAPCTGACPQGIDIKGRLVGAHDLLTLA